MLSKKWLNEASDSVDLSSINYRFDEYSALTGEVVPSKGTGFDFVRESIPAEEYALPHVKSVALIDKVRVVSALAGFSRINPVSSRDSEGFVDIKKTDLNWLPAYEVKGEGVFVEFDNEDIEKWIAKNPEVISRANLINENYDKSFISNNNPRIITPKFIMLHTLAPAFMHGARSIFSKEPLDL